FSHFEAMTAEEIARVENIVNTKIWENLPVTTQMMNLADALKTGAMAEFGEKYEDSVRVVKAGSFSTELCGGTHVDNTGKIGVFKILKESSPGAGIRRIEGLTLKGVLERFSQINESLSNVLSIVNCAEKDLAQRIKDLQQKNKDLETELASFSKGKLADTALNLLSSAEKIKGTDVITAKIENLSGDDLKTLADLIRERSSDCAVILISSFEGKVIIVAAATQTAVAKGADSGALIKAVAPILGGGGGGRKDMAQAGGKDFSKADEAIASAKNKISEMIK
nr:alanine--tRNA ligase [Spirochaetota bacterium]